VYCVADGGVLATGIVFVEGAFRYVRAGIAVPEGFYNNIPGDTWQWRATVGKWGQLAPEGCYVLDGAWRLILPGGVLAPADVYDINDDGELWAVAAGGIVSGKVAK
jgi:hypothetical protein